MPNRRRLRGEFVSDKMSASAVVAVVRLKKHSKYKKYYKVTKKYAVHNENNEFKTGDKVVIEECAPISKTKKFRIVQKVGRVLNEGAEPSEVEDSAPINQLTD
jgi:small subunit ribosomal protein S17